MAPWSAWTAANATVTMAGSRYVGVSACPGVTFDQLSVGQSVRDATTITETKHLVLAAGVFKDFNPVHADESFAAASRFGTRVVHGMLTAGMMIGVLGSYLGAGALALVEQQLRFVGAVHPGDTVATEWMVEALEPKPRLREGGGLVMFTAERAARSAALTRLVCTIQ